MSGASARSAWDDRDAIAARLREGFAVFLDFDGTLTPIVDDPDAPGLSPSMRARVARLAQKVPVAIVSGRDRADVAARVGIARLVVAGSHGLDIEGRGHARVHPEAERQRVRLDEVEARLRERLAAFRGVVIERKRFSLAVHHRQVAETERAAVCAIVEEEAAGLTIVLGKCVQDLVLDVAWDKGRAVRWIHDEVFDGRGVAVYLGDDRTDEHAFIALEDDGVGVLVGDHGAPTRARWSLPDVDAVERFLEWLTSTA